MFVYILSTALSELLRSMNLTALKIKSSSKTSTHETKLTIWLNRKRCLRQIYFQKSSTPNQDLKKLLTLKEKRKAVIP